MSRSRDIVFLLGAGASAEAGIPTSAEMIDRIQGRLRSDWTEFAELYNHVRSAIHYSAGLKGRFNNDVPYNIETLVNTLYELERNEDHPVYPFIAAWNSRFVSLAGPKFEQVKTFRHKILTALKGWMCLADPSEADYYKGLIGIQRALNFPLRIFSLNYDSCVESLSSSEFVVEVGFSGFGPKHVWSFERFLENDRGENPLPQVFLYKLHGSIDWVRDKTSQDLSRVQQIELITADQMEVIFGREFKLEAADPYLFYAYEFRQSALEAKLIVAVGYGFADEHINKMLSQALRPDGARQLLVVAKREEEKAREAKRLEIAQKLGVPADRITVDPGTAKSFLSSGGVAKRLVEAVAEPAGSF